MADCAGLKFSTGILTDNISFEWSGYDSSLPTYIQTTIELIVKLRNSQIEEIFNDKKEEKL